MRLAQLIFLLVLFSFPAPPAKGEPVDKAFNPNLDASERVWAPRIVGTAPNNEAGVITLPDGSLRCIYTNIEKNRVESISSLDGGVTWSTPKVEFETPGRTGHACQVVLDRNGEIHVFFLNIRGRGKIGVEYFIDVFQATSTNARTAWTTPEPVFANSYVGAIRGATLLASGRLLVSFAEWVVNSPHEKQSGPHEIRVLYSDDNGKTWMPAKAGMTAPIRADYNGSKYGAVEPAIIELRKGLVWMLIRTQTGRLYESFSKDGSIWSPAVPSRFYSSNSPATLLKLSGARTLLIWNNCEAPPAAPDGNGVYGGRDALHAAVSDDGGRTWRGFREIYRDPTRNVSPPKRGDRGTAYANAALTRDGKIFVTTGQGPARAMLLFDAKWLDEKSRVDNLDDGLDGWTIFKSFGPASGWWRDRVAGPKLIKAAGGSPEVGLLFTHPDTNEPDSAIWNFPARSRGSVELHVMLKKGSHGGRVSLNDRFFDPGDQNGEKSAMFTTLIQEEGQPAAGIRLPASSWHVVRFDWDLAQGKCKVSVDGRPTAVLRAANKTENGISYLRLGSTPNLIDSSGFLIRRVSANVGAAYPAIGRR
jgi:hypothetical protein